MTRRQFLYYSGTATAGTLLYTTSIEPHWTEYVYRKMPVTNLPDHLVGRTLIQISDTHIGERVSSGFLLEEFRNTTALQPDFVVYTGDHVDYGSDDQLEEMDRVFAEAPRGKLGTVAILGNHDYGKGFRLGSIADRVSRKLTESGITVLRNSRTTVAGLTITGLDDFWGTNFNPRPALARIDPAGANLVLCHNPDVCDLNVWSGYQGWILSGHTHGGQCRVPGFAPPVLPIKNKAYAAGEIDLRDGRRLYVNRALGHSHRVRFAVRPEITVFTLSRNEV